MATPSLRHRGWHLNDDRTELTVQFNGVEKMAINSTGVSFLGSAAPTGVLDITGNTSSYQEATIKLIIDALVALGLVTDSTT